jgi:hypothetical protein
VLGRGVGRCVAERACPHDRSGVVISNDLPTNGSRFLIIHDGREIDVGIAILLADPAVHGGVYALAKFAESSERDLIARLDAEYR